MRANGERRSYPVQVIVAADEQGANVMLDSSVLHRAAVAMGEEPIVKGCGSGGKTHPAVDRAIQWAQDNSYAVAVVTW